MLKPRETVAALFQFVGLVPVGYNDPEMGRLFGRHGTSHTLVWSIGRCWRELNAGQFGGVRGLWVISLEFRLRAIVIMRRHFVRQEAVRLLRARARDPYGPSRSCWSSR
jgi:hypothetical protein